MRTGLNAGMVAWVLVGGLASGSMAQNRYALDGPSGFIQDFDSADPIDLIGGLQGTWRAELSVPTGQLFLVSNSQNQGGSLTRYGTVLLHSLMIETANFGTLTIVSSDVEGSISYWDRATFRGGSDNVGLDFDANGDGAVDISFAYSAIADLNDAARGQMFTRGTPNPNVPLPGFIPQYPDATEGDRLYSSRGITVTTFGLPAAGRYNGNADRLREPGGTVCVPDFTGDGVLNVFDIFAFFTVFGGGTAAADLSGDGLVNIFDIFEFFALFGAGC